MGSYRHRIAIMSQPSYLRTYSQNRGPNYRPALVGQSDLGGLMRGVSFSTVGVPTGTNFTPKGSIYDGYDSFAEASMGAETTAWMKASTRARAAQQLEHSRYVADSVGDKRVYMTTPYSDAMNHEFKPRNAWVPTNHAATPQQSAIYPTREAGKYLSRPEVPQVYQDTFPHLFESERVPPMFNPYWFPEAAIHRHYQGHPTMPLPPLLGANEAMVPEIDNAAQAAVFDEERPIFGEGCDWWKWKVISSDPVDNPKAISFREHEDGHAIFKGLLTANLPNGNSTEGALDGFALARSCETLLDLTALGGIEIAVRGDGKTYSVALGLGASGYSSVQYVAKIPAKATAHKWRVVRIPWAAFLPQFKSGYDAEGAPPMSGMVSWIGFGIGDRQWGPFTLEVAYVRAVA